MTMLTKFTPALALAFAAIFAVPASVGSSFAQSPPTLASPSFAQTGADRNSVTRETVIHECSVMSAKHFDISEEINLTAFRACLGEHGLND
jgi:hypothetical protein